MTTSLSIPSTALPKTVSEQIEWLCLMRSRRVGPATFRRLITEYGTAQHALNALPEIAKKSGAKNYAPCSLSVAKSEYERGIYSGYTPLFLGGADYPKLLAQCPDAPAFLWAVGKIDLAQKSAIGIVGARNASALGQRITKSLAKGLGEFGHVIVSGLARGIDTAAHEAALDTGTIAVVAGGLDISYPKENSQLQSQIAKSGLVLSEQALGTIPQARHFPQRNRIIAGLVRGLCVIEGAARSGSLITARAASDYGRDVMAVPGSPFDPRATGCNMLIRDGAVLIRNAQDIHDHLHMDASFSEPESPAQVPRPQNQIGESEVQSKIMDMLSHAAIAEDIVIRDSGFGAENVSRILAKMEMEGRISRQPGGLLARAS